MFKVSGNAQGLLLQDLTLAGGTPNVVGLETSGRTAAIRVTFSGHQALLAGAAPVIATGGAASTIFQDTTWSNNQGDRSGGLSAISSVVNLFGTNSFIRNSGKEAGALWVNGNDVVFQDG